MSLNEITLEEAAKRTGRSRESIRRQIGHGIQGRKVPSKHGRFQWMVDADTLPPADPHTIEAQEAHEAYEAQEPQTLPAVPPERLLATLEALATRQDIEKVIQMVDNSRQLTKERDALRAEVERLQRELSAERSRPWWKRRKY